MAEHDENVMAPLCSGTDALDLERGLLAAESSRKARAAQYPDVDISRACPGVDETGTNWAERCAARFLRAVADGLVPPAPVPGNTDLGSESRPDVQRALLPICPKAWARMNSTSTCSFNVSSDESLDASSMPAGSADVLAIGVLDSQSMAQVEDEEVGLSIHGTSGG